MTSSKARRFSAEEPLKAFVISVIGGTDEQGLPNHRRDYANRVFAKLIEPAFAEAGADGRKIRVERSDHKAETGSFVEQIVDNILENDLVVALLSEPDPLFWNPNVFYELGIAKAAGRPVIMLIRDDQPIPSDLSVEMLVRYNERHIADDADPGEAGGPAQQILSKVRTLIESPDRFYEAPFGEDRAIGRAGAMERFRNVAFNDLSDMILSANQEIWFAGATLRQLIENNGPNSQFCMPDENYVLQTGAQLRELLGYQIARGVSVSVLMLHPENPHLERLVKQDADTSQGAVRARLQERKAKARASLKAWQAVRGFARNAHKIAVAEGKSYAAETPGDFDIVQVRQRAILNRITATERRALVTPYFYSLGFNSGPCVDAKAGSLWHSTAVNDLRLLKTLNTKSSRGWLRRGA